MARRTRGRIQTAPLRRIRLPKKLVENAGGETEAVDHINGAFDDLEGMKRTSIARTGPLLRSKLAWKYAGLRMALIYRLADLGEATIREWCDENTLSSIVLARAFIETVAVVNWIVKKGGVALAAGSIVDLDALVMTTSFGTKIPRV